jgi:hypothetical protein
MKKWEYLSVIVAFNKEGKIALIYSNYLPDPDVPSNIELEYVAEYINKLGDQGWELVSVLPETHQDGKEYIFKRSKK